MLKLNPAMLENNPDKSGIPGRLGIAGALALLGKPDMPLAI
jgi:hypothetical protein